MVAFRFLFVGSHQGGHRARYVALHKQLQPRPWHAALTGAQATQYGRIQAAAAVLDLIAWQPGPPPPRPNGVGRSSGAVGWYVVPVVCARESNHPGFRLPPQAVGDGICHVMPRPEHRGSTFPIRKRCTTSSRLSQALQHLAQHTLGLHR